MRKWLVGIASALLASAHPSAQAGAQQAPPTDGGRTSALGQPKTFKWTAGVGVGWGRDDYGSRGSAIAQLGVFHDLINPVLGIGGLNLEAYAGARDTRSINGVRVRVASPAVRLGVGADYNTADKDVRFLLSVYSPVKRGGFFNNGTELRFDVLPFGHPQFGMSIEIPVMRRIPTGKTRPHTDRVRLSAAPAPALMVPANSAQLAEPLANARAAAALIRRLNVPFLDEISSNRMQDETAVLARIRDLATAIPSTAGAEPAIEGHVRRFHAEVERAFSIALASVPDSGSPAAVNAAGVARKARSILLDEVLFPYDRLLGQVKADDTTEEFAKRARGAFMRWLHTESHVPHESIDAIAWVFSSVLEMVEANRAALRQDWRDSRFVWLPLQYGLTAEQHDTQAELDALVEQGVGTRFTEGNSISYVINEQFQSHLASTIWAAQDYHVLWIHDFRGYDKQGDPDEMSYQQVLYSYLGAMTHRVREYDKTGHLPVYMIMLDEWFYQANDAMLWMDLLEDPTRHTLHLPKKNADWEQAIRRAQDSLRTAIGESHLLQAQREQYGDAWLRDLIKVHVSVTNASDPSFWSWRVARMLPLFDNLIRDHRKLVFYDITEDDPYRGGALFTGAGVGEHYVSLAWEDRALRVNGPALLGLKTAARDALLQQGMSRERIPLALQPHQLAPDYAARVARQAAKDSNSIRALTIANETGFGPKQINVAKGVLYTLMPPGSVIKIPDSLWNSAFWGSALVGAALRGVRVLIIGPAYSNAPARAFGSMIRGEELFWKLLTVARELRPQIEGAGGLLRVGVFKTDRPVTDLPGKMQSISDAFTKHEWLRTLFDYPPSVYKGFRLLADSLRDLKMEPSTQARFESDSRPKLHLKANFFASREAWGLMSRPEWPGIQSEFVQQRLKQNLSLADSSYSIDDFRLPLIDVGDATVKDWFKHLAPAARDRVVFYTVMGSQNQNARSMVEDGEDAIVVSRWPSVIPYLDLLAIIGQSEWLDDPAQLAALLPQGSALKRRLAHWFKLAF